MIERVLKSVRCLLTICISLITVTLATQSQSQTPTEQQRKLVDADTDTYTRKWRYTCFAVAFAIAVASLVWSNLKSFVVDFKIEDGKFKNWNKNFSLLLLALSEENRKANLKGSNLQLKRFLYPLFWYLERSLCNTYFAFHGLLIWPFGRK